MEIAFILPSDRISGGSFVVYEHGVGLRAMGHDVTIIFRSDARHPGPSSLEGFELPSISWSEARRRRFDVVVATWWETAFDMFRIPSGSYAYFVQSDERRFYLDPDAVEPSLVEATYWLPVPVVTEARWIQEMFRAEFQKETALAPNAVSHDIFFPDSVLSPKAKKLRVLVEGPGAVPYKRVALCFEVLREISDVEVWYVSTDGHLEPEWKCDRVFAPQSREEMRKVYSSCDVLLKLSVVEGFFCPPLEMMACGGTVVVSRVTGFDEFVKDGTNGLVVDIDDAPAAIRAIVRLRDDRGLLEQLKRSAVETARTMKWAESTQRFEAFLKDVVATGALLSKEGCALLNVLIRIREAMPTSHNSRFVSASELNRELSAAVRSVAERMDQLDTIFVTRQEGAEQLTGVDTQLRALDAKHLSRQEFEVQLRELDAQFRAIVQRFDTGLNAVATRIDGEISRLSEQVQNLQVQSNRGALRRLLGALFG